MNNLVTIKQAKALRDLGYSEPTTRYAYDFGEDGNYRIQNQECIGAWNKMRRILPVPTVDEVIDWLRKKHHIIIYNCIEPFVDPTTNGHIKYGYRVKKCNKKWGWNYREYISSAIISNDCYAAKRICIWIAIRYIKKQSKNGKKKNILSGHKLSKNKGAQKK